MIQILSFLFSPTFFYIFLAIAGVIVIFLLCKAFPDFKPVLKYGALIIVLSVSLLGSFYFGNQINGYYSAEGGIFGKITESLGFEIKHSEDEPQKFEFNNLSLQSDVYGRYSAKISLKDVLTLDNSKSYGVEVNGQPTTSIMGTSTHILAIYSYKFYSELDKDLFSDDLYISFELNQKSTNILIYTNNGDSLRYWKRYVQKNGFILEIKENIYEKNKNVNVQEAKGNVSFSLQTKQSDILMPENNFKINLLWSDGQRTYYSNESSHYVLDDGDWKVTNFEYTFNGTDIWNAYGKTFLRQSKMLANENKFEDVNMGVSISNFSTFDLWTHGGKVYYSSSNGSYYLTEDFKWTEQTFYGLTNFNGRYVWTDGEQTYYSYGVNQYVLVGNAWQKQEWAGLSNFNGTEVWTCNGNTFCSYVDQQYILNGSVWEKVEVVGDILSVDGSSIWTDGAKAFAVGYNRATGENKNYELNLKVSLKG